jgi:co-chaperonin GroES (HSP10)
MNEMNPTGIKPVEFKVLLKVDELEDKTSGGLWIPDHALDREQMAHDRGTLVAVSDMAFSDWKGRIPCPGDNVIFNKYAGSIINFQEKGKARQQYRLCNDKDICAVIDKIAES